MDGVDSGYGDKVAPRALQSVLPRETHGGKASTAGMFLYGLALAWINVPFL